MSLERVMTADEFCLTHDVFVSHWGRAMESGVTLEVENFYGSTYFVTFLAEPGKEPSVEDRVSAMEGMRQSVLSLRGATKRFENRITRVRDSNSIVVFYEQVIERDGTERARLLTIEDWQRLSGGWKIVRETVEVV
jgi:hypothetical protein